MRMQAKLPLASQTQRALSVLDQLLRGHCQAVIQWRRLTRMFGHLLPTGTDIHQEILRCNFAITSPFSGALLCMQCVMSASKRIPVGTGPL